MPDRLVDLQLHLSRVQHERGDLARALRRGEQLDGLVAGPLGLLDQAAACGRAPTPPRRCGPGTSWGTTAAAARPRRPRSPRSRRPSARRSARSPSPRVVASHVWRRNRSMPPSAKSSPSTPCIRRVASISRATFSSSGTLKGSSCIGECHVPVDRLDRRELDGFHRQAGGGASDLDGELGRAVDLGVLEAGGRREPPVAVDEDPDADPVGRRPVDALHLLVAHRERLGLVRDDPAVGVVGAGGLRRFDGLLRDVEHPG